MQSEDYPDNTDLIDQLSIPVNSAFEELYSALNNRLTFRENISATIAEFTVTVDTDGVPKNNTQVKLLNNQTTVEGLIVINAVGTKDPTLLPTTGIFVTFTRNDNFVVIQNVSGLRSSLPYTIKVIILG